MAASDLPIELWHRIASYCSKSDLRSLRLTCSGVSAVADEWFLRDLTIFFVRDDFENAVRLTKNPRIANNVRTVHFQADLLPGASGYKQWDTYRRNLIELSTRPNVTRREIDELNELCTTERGRRLVARERKQRVARESRKHSKSELKAAYRHYVELYKDQAYLITQARARACLQDVFKACTKIESVFVILRDDASPEARCWKASIPLLNTMIEPLGDTSTTQIGVRAVDATMFAAFEVSRKLPELEMSPISYQFFKQSDEAMEKLYTVISNTEKLRITINDRFNSDIESGLQETAEISLEQNVVQQIFLSETTAAAAQRVLTSFHDGRLARFLSHATSLRYLSIVPPGEVQWWPGQMRLRDIVGDMVWPNLKTLGICNFTCDAAELSDLLLRHSHTLDDLGLGHVEIVAGTWRECLDSFAGKLPHLRVADLHGTFRDSTTLDGPLRLSCYCGDDTEYAAHVLCNFTRQVNQYILKGGIFPKLPQSPSTSDDDGDDSSSSEDEEEWDGPDAYQLAEEDAYAADNFNHDASTFW